MALAARRLPENAPGPFFVDDTCIDCGKCREVAPATFAAARRGVSFVRAQPEGEPARHPALMALVACPTASIGVLADDTYLFTGDHLWGSEDGTRLSASRGVCWYSWSEQRRSLDRLLDHRFEWVLPGHGRRFRAASAAVMRAALERLLRELPA